MEICKTHNERYSAKLEEGDHLELAYLGVYWRIILKLVLGKHDMRF